MTRRLRAGVIGVGSMGRNHARAYAGMEEVDLVAVCDASTEIVSKIAHTYRCAAYTDFRLMLAQMDLDLVSIVVPTKHHYRVAAEVIDYGVSVLIEKPIAATVEEGYALVDAARRRGVTLTVGHIERFNPAIISLKQQIDDHEIGNVFQISARRVGPFPARIEDVGVVIDLATHEVDILNYLIGSPIVRMHVELHRHVHQTHEDMLSAVLRFENGVVGMLDINWLTPTKIRELSVVGERGMFVANYLTQDLTFYENDACQGKAWPELALIGVSEGRSIRQKVQRREPLVEELRSFCEAVRTGNPPVVSGEAGIAALAIANQIIAAGNAGRSQLGLLERAVGI
ncbi:Gfo/Idh/MocA family oxidoreductase [Candidatus Chloroploca sp. M-50]|uniref:Gfo/Idh/MocA family oxidoreductase n=1 Tax=Candidatus Chloroploca mongolica TaxID=2528176 RepID=A0ABS4DC02_9CHLR|nr:Gfo/Idh/MocA family oxidoreductase [Candidatus Chloroploca mongolica]MBP1466829.1 Gfo/Idh/MocA family oxidoreductase [Candidatus Chloroploca mongolica]